MDMETIKAIIKALRTGGYSPRRVYDSQGGIYREEPAGSGGMLEAFNRRKRSLEYDKYKMMQERMGETPVSYEEWK
jgi:hypothetical protein